MRGSPLQAAHARSLHGHDSNKPIRAPRERLGVGSGWRFSRKAASHRRRGRDPGDVERRTSAATTRRISAAAAHHAVGVFRGNNASEKSEALRKWISRIFSGGSAPGRRSCGTPAGCACRGPAPAGWSPAAAPPARAIPQSRAARRGTGPANRGAAAFGGPPRSRRDAPAGRRPACSDQQPRPGLLQGRPNQPRRDPPGRGAAVLSCRKGRVCSKGALVGHTGSPGRKPTPQARSAGPC